MQRAFAALLLVAIPLLSGCSTYTQRLGQDFYQAPQMGAEIPGARGLPALASAQPPLEKIPLTVGVVKGEPLSPLKGGHCMGLIGEPWVETSIEGDYQAGFISALSVYFKSAVEVDTMDPKQRVDVLAKVDRNFPGAVGLSLYDAKSKALLQDIRIPFVADAQHLLDEPCDPALLAMSALFWDTVGWDILFPAWAALVEGHDYKKSLTGMRPRLSNTMSVISQRAASSLALNFKSAPRAEVGQESEPAAGQKSAPASGDKPWWQQQ